MPGDDEGRDALRLERVRRLPTTKRLIRAIRRVERGARPVLQRVSDGIDSALLRTVAARRSGELSGRSRALRDAVAAIRVPPVPQRSIDLFVLGVEGGDRHFDDVQPIAIGDGSSVSRTEVSGPADLPALLAGSTADVLAFVAETSEPLSAGWLGHLVAAIDVPGGVAAAAPAVVHPGRPPSEATPDDLLLRQVGLAAELTPEGEVHLISRLAGHPVQERDRVAVDAVGAACLAVDRLTLEAAGGWQPLASLDASVVDLALRLRAAGTDVVTVPDAVIADHRPVPSRRALREPFERDASGWQAVLARHGPALVHRAREGAGNDTGRLTVAITVASFRRVAPRWGDWHLGHALARSLRLAGCDVVVVPGDEAEGQPARTADLQLVIRGLRRFPRTSGQRHVLWVISHPEAIETSECDDADLVLVASERFADELRARTRTPVEVLLQATDHRRFKPCQPDPRHAHPLAVVAKTRDEFRPAVAFALQQGLRPAIYGSGWERLVDRDLIAADHVPNEDLPVVYSSVGLLLNDHWTSMRDRGFVSNRIFDALACGTPVISDHVVGLAEIMGSVVPTYCDAPSLRQRVEETFADLEGARLRAAQGRRLVLERHTFDRRAAELLAALERHDLHRPG